MKSYTGYGAEPKYEPGTTLTTRQVDDYSTWHNYMSSNRQGRAWLLEWLKADPRLEAVKKLRPTVVLPTYGWWAKMMLDGYKLPDIVMERFNTAIDHLVKKYAQVMAPVERVGIGLGEQTILSLVREWAADGDHDRSLTAYLEGVSAPRSTVKNVANIMRAKRASDEEVATFLKRMVEEADAYVESHVPARKPRAKKAVDPDKLVKALRYLPQHASFFGNKPVDILGAKEVFLYNPKYHVFTHVVAEEGKTLSVEGARIINIDQKKSASRNAGRRDREIIGAPVPVLRHIIGELKTFPLPISGRVGENTLILKVHK